MEDVFKFMENPESYVGMTDEFVARIYPVNGVDELYDKLYTELNFPDYYLGFNWNGLNDCLRDLDWIEAENVTLVHDDSLEMEDGQFEIYISVLYDSILNWKYLHNKEKFLSAIFSIKQMERINSALIQAEKKGQLSTPSILIRK